MEQIKVYKLSDGSFIEDKNKAINRQNEIDLNERIRHMTHMFDIEVMVLNHIYKDENYINPIDEIKNDLESIGYYINGTGISKHDEYNNTIFYAVYKDK